MEICHVCRKPVKAKDASWFEIQVSRQTMSEPAEYDEVPVCPSCVQIEPERDEAYERQAARYDGDGKDWR